MNKHEPDTLMIWVKGSLVEVYSEDGRRNYGVQTKIHYVMDRQTGKFVPEGEETIQMEPEAESLITGYFGLKLKKQERKTVQIIGERPFSVDYGKIRDDDPHVNDIHEIANDEYTGNSYEYMKLKNEVYIRPVLVVVPKKFVSLSPTDHRRFFASSGGKSSASSGRRVGS